MKFAVIIPVLLILICNSTLAQEHYVSDRPGIGNSSFVVSLNSFGVETGMSARHTNFGIQADLGQFLIRYGVAEKLELRGILNSYSLIKLDLEPRSATGFQNVGFGAKYNINTLVDGKFRSSVGAEVSFPIGDFIYAPDRIIPTVTYLADYKLSERWAISANVGYSYGVQDFDDKVLLTATPSFKIKGNDMATIYFGYAGVYDGNTYNQHFIEFGGTLKLSSNIQMDFNTGYEADKVALFMGVGFSAGF